MINRCSILRTVIACDRVIQNILMERAIAANQNQDYKSILKRLNSKWDIWADAEGIPRVFCGYC